MDKSIDSLSKLSTADLFTNKAKESAPSGTADFAKELQSALNEANEIQQEKEKAVADLATGQVKDLHQAALAIGKAELNMKLMLEIRNKALNAYKEISRTQM